MQSNRTGVSGVAAVALALLIVGCASVFAVCSATGSIHKQTVRTSHRIVLASPLNYERTLAESLPGDTILLDDGVWPDVKLTVARGGSKSEPLLIKAKTPGKAVLTGSSSVEIDAPYVTVEGLLFTKGAVAKGAVIRFNSNNGVVRNTAIVDYNPADPEIQYYWVFFNGVDNLVDRCYFHGKDNKGPLVGNALADSRHNSVTHSYYKDVPYRHENGREILRIWGSGKYLELGADGAYFTIEGNLFEHADGEGQEIISLKSNHNRVVRNTIIGTRGGIVLRGGNFNTVTDNIVLGRGATKAYGVRIAGQNHLVEHNFISGCDHGIDILCGDYIQRDLTGKYVPKLTPDEPHVRVPTYGQVKSLRLTSNIVVGSKKSDLEIGGSFKRQWPEDQMVLLPEDCVVSGNRFVRPDGGQSVIGVLLQADSIMKQFAFKENRYENNVLVGGENAFAPSAAGFTLTPKPTGWTEAGEMSGFKPLTPADVGPDWMRSVRGT